jgi:hypothetical protein
MRRRNREPGFQIGLENFGFEKSAFERLWCASSAIAENPAIPAEK